MKAKAKNKNGRLLVTVKLSKNEELGERELDLLSKKTILGLLKPERKRKNIIEYSGPAGISLQDRLKRTLTMREFFLVMAQITDASRKIKKNGMFDKNLLLDPRYVFMNENTNELQFLYLPLVSSYTCADFLGFMSALVYAAKNDVNQSSDYISKFAFFLRGLEAFSPDEIDAYIADADRDAMNQVRNKNPRESGFITNKHNEYYKHYSQQNEADTDYDYDEQTGPLTLTAIDDFDDFDADTGLLTENDEEDELEEEGTALLQGMQVKADKTQPEKAAHYMTLRRKLTDELVSINKPVFRVGKEKSYVDYFVADNNAVSRSHADLIVRGNRCFVKDLNSKNRTYINGEAIYPNVEMELFDGDIILFANEEFVFKM